MAKSQYVTLPIDAVRVDPRNERYHPPEQIELIKTSIRMYGQRRRVLIDRTNMVVAHHGVLEALRELGETSVKCKYSELTGAKRDAYRVADNQLAALSRLNPERTRRTIAKLQRTDEEKFNAAGLGLTADQLRRIREGNGNGWSGKDIDIDSIPDYDADLETLIVKIEQVAKKDAPRLVKELNDALERLDYKAVAA